MPPGRRTPEINGPIGPAVGAFVGHNTDAESGGMAGGISLHFPSTFPPPDALPRGTGRNGRGRRMIVRAFARPFVHVTTYNWGQGQSPAFVRPSPPCAARRSPTAGRCWRAPAGTARCRRQDPGHLVRLLVRCPMRPLRPRGKTRRAPESGGLTAGPPAGCGTGHFTRRCSNQARTVGVNLDPTCSPSPPGWGGQRQPGGPVIEPCVPTSPLPLATILGARQRCWPPTGRSPIVSCVGRVQPAGV